MYFVVKNIFPHFLIPLVFIIVLECFINYTILFYRDFYELGDFPVHCLLTRCSVGKKKNIYYTSSSIKDIVKNNQDRVKVSHTFHYLLVKNCFVI